MSYNCLRWVEVGASDRISPQVLRALARGLQIPYYEILRLAGYLSEVGLQAAESAWTIERLDVTTGQWVRCARLANEGPAHVELQAAGRLRARRHYLTQSRSTHEDSTQDVASS